MNLRPFLIAICLITAAAWVIAQETLPDAAAPPAEQAPAPGVAADPEAALANAPPTDARHYSYAIGIDIGSSFKSDQLKLDADSLLAGVRDGLAGAQPRYTAELCGVALQRLARERAEVLHQRSRAFLAENAKKEGVQTLPSGLQIKILKSGPAAGPSPTATSTVRALYRGTLMDGTVFDASEEARPVAFNVSRVIPGWTEALQKMKVGDKWQLFIPPELAYQAEGRGDAIPPNAALIFEIELVGIE